MHNITIQVKGFDKDAFLKAASDEYDVFVAKYSADQDSISAAVNAIFDKYPGVRLNVDALQSFVLIEMKAEPSTYKVMSERLDIFLAANKGERGKALLGTAKGKNGGIWRWKDQPEASAK